MSTLPFFHTFIIPFISSFPSLCQLKKDAKCKNFELNFIWGKIKTAVWETAPQIVLRKCSTIPRNSGGGQYNFGEGGVQCNQACILQKVFCSCQGADVNMRGFSAFVNIKRCKDWDYETTKISNYLKTCSTNFPGTECLTVHPELSSGHVEGQQLQQQRA